MKTASLGLLAHQGGWDEFLLVALPLVAIGALLFLANKRVAAKLDDERAVPPGDEPTA